MDGHRSPTPQRCCAVCCVLWAATYHFQSHLLLGQQSSSSRSGLGAHTTQRMEWSRALYLIGGLIILSAPYIHCFFTMRDPSIRTILCQAVGTGPIWIELPRSGSTALLLLLRYRWYTVRPLLSVMNIHKTIYIYIRTRIWTECWPGTYTGQSVRLRLGPRSICSSVGKLLTAWPLCWLHLNIPLIHHLRIVCPFGQNEWVSEWVTGDWVSALHLQIGQEFRSSKIEISVRSIIDI